MAWGSASLIDSHTGVITRIQVLSFSDLQSSQQRVDEKESGRSKLKIAWRGAKRTHETLGAMGHKRELPTSWLNQLIRFVSLSPSLTRDPEKIGNGWIHGWERTTDKRKSPARQHFLPPHLHTDRWQHSWKLTRVHEAWLKGTGQPWDAVLGRPRGTV